jgi:hypothetical protein
MIHKTDPRIAPLHDQYIDETNDLPTREGFILWLIAKWEHERREKIALLDSPEPARNLLFNDLQTELAEAREMIAFMVKVTPLDVLRMKAGNGFLNMELVDAAFEAAAAFLAAQPARADDTRTAGE